MHKYLGPKLVIQNHCGKNHHVKCINVLSYRDQQKIISFLPKIKNNNKVRGIPQGGTLMCNTFNSFGKLG